MKRIRFLCAVAAVIFAFSTVMMQPIIGSANTPGQALRQEDVKYGKVSNASQKELKKMFDAEYYAETQPDVVKAFGKNKNALFKHFIKYGIFEGRACSADFNVSAYKSCYKDLQKAFGDDIVAYYMHYAKYGKAEKRELVTVEKAVAAGYLVTSVTGTKDVYNIPLPDWAKPAPKRTSSTSNNTSSSSGSSSGSGSTPSGNPPEQTPTTINISGAATVKKGASIQLTSNVTGVTWAVSPAVSGASINSSGLLAISYGCEATSVKVTATKEGCTGGEKTISIATPALSIGSATVSKGSTATLTAYIDGAESSDGMTWSVETPGTLVTIASSTGVLTVPAEEPGNSVTVKVEHTGCTSATQTITLSDLPTISITGDSSMKKGQSITLTANPSDGTTWTIVGSASGATITSAGLLTVPYTYSGSNTLTVKASHEGYADSTRDIGISESALSISAAGNATAITKGESLTLSAYVEGNLINEDLTWTITTSNENVSVTDGVLTTAVNATGSSVTVKVTHVGCTDGTISIGLNEAPSVAITGSSVVRGKSVTLTADAASVTWSLASAVPGASINASTGELTIGYNCTAQSVEVNAASPGYNTGSKTINITKPTLVIEPATTGTLTKGNSLVLTAKVGTDDLSAVPSLDWSITAGDTSNISLSGSGTLTRTLTTDYQASGTSVTVSVSNDDLFEAGTLTVNLANITPVIKDSAGNTDNLTVKKGYSITLKAYNGETDITDELDWAVTAGSSSEISLSGSVLTVSAEEEGTTVTVTASKTGVVESASVNITMSAADTISIDTAAVTRAGDVVLSATPADVSWELVTATSDASISAGTLHVDLGYLGETIVVRATKALYKSALKTITVTNATIDISEENGGALSVTKGSAINLIAKVGSAQLAKAAVAAEGLQWSIKDAPEHATISADGELNIEAEYASDTITVIATYPGCDAGEQTITVTDPDPGP